MEVGVLARQRVAGGPHGPKGGVEKPKLRPVCKGSQRLRDCPRRHHAKRGKGHGRASFIGASTDGAVFFSHDHCNNFAIFDCRATRSVIGREILEEYYKTCHGILGDADN